MTFDPWLIASGCSAAAGAAVIYGVCAPRSSLFGPVVSHGSRDGPPRVALTFDDGPHPVVTPVVLDILRSHGIPAAFFVIGRNVVEHEAIAQRAAAEGHLIANHTFDHQRSGAWRAFPYWRRELRQANDAVAAAIGQRPALFRPPMGLKTPHILYACRREAMTLVTWNRRGLDGWRTTPQAILRRLVCRCRGGDILVLHDGAEPGRDRDSRAMLQALPRLIDALRSRGLAFERLDRLIARPGYLPDDPTAARR